MPLFEQTKERYLRTPRLSPASAEGGATLHLIAWTPEGEHLLHLDLDDRGEIVAERADAPLDAIAGLSWEHPPRPTADPRVGARAEAEGWRAEVAWTEGRSTVWVTPPSAEPIRVWEAIGTATAPALATSGEGAWVAFHHDVREDTGMRDIAKWIALRFVDASGAVFEPAAEMTGRDRDLDGVEQSFEFPSLVAGEDGALDLFGRGSQNFYRQRLDASGFAPREAISDGEWACRGRRIALTRLRDGSTLSARRERKGIAVDRFDGPVGGRAELRPATVVQPPAAIASSPTAGLEGWGGPTVLFGDIQQHSAHSDGIGAADEPYLRARHAYGDDFVALTDHESFIGKRIGPGEWAYLEAVAEYHHRPGEFVSIIAYEWTGRMHPGPGHKVVYLPGPGQRIISRDELPEGFDIVRAVSAEGAFAVPHHIGWTGADEAAHDPDLVPVWEICSVHGCYEEPENPLGFRGDHPDQLAKPMLDKGHRFGFIACSDSHGLLWHHGESRKRDPFRTGLTAVLAEERTRGAILGAIRERRCYGTSGAKIFLDTRIGDAPMGSTLAPSGEVRLRVRARGAAAIERVDWVGRRGVLASAVADSRDVTTEAVIDAEGDYVYVRVTQADGEMAWSSPYFFDLPPTA